eukprot:gene10389-2918_t
MTTFSVCTYNVNWGLCLTGNMHSQHAQSIKTAISTADSDIVCLQETHEGFEKILTKLFEKKYPYQIHKLHKSKLATLDNKEGSLAGGLSVLSKYPIYEVSYYQPKTEGSFFPALIFRAEIVKSLFVEIVNVHLSNQQRPPISKTHRPTIGDYFTTSNIRKEEIKELLTQMTKSDMKIICGDFNESSGACLSFLKDEAKYNDILMEYCDGRNTWFWPLFWGMSLYGAYDHIFYNCSNNKFTSIGGTVFEEFKDISDHIPVVGKFIIKE